MLFSYICGIFLAIGAALASPSVSPRQSTPVAAVKNGSYLGLHNSEFNQDFFLGLPFAQPPIGDLRYRVPQSLNTSWTSPKEATTWPPFCVGYGGDDTSHILSEDCLYLNVLRPSSQNAASAKLPVAVWIHGGGLFMGGTNDPRYNLSFNVQNSVELGMPMVGISIQYRLSGWGFLGGKEALEGGATNLGFRDQRLALHWIQENIAAFGGDPTRVTIWGESAGGQSVGSQLLAYNGRDDHLFIGAIAESGGPAVSFFPATLPGGYNSSVYQSTYDGLVLSTSCAPTLTTGNSLECLRQLPFQEINATLYAGYGTWAPQIDGDFIATYPSLQLLSGNFVRVPLLIGTNTDEGTAFGTGYGVIDTDADFLSILNSTDIPSDSKTAAIISYLYPNIQAIGIPSLITYPVVVEPSSEVAALFGLQFRRMAAYFGDIVVNAPRRASNHAWSTFGIPSYSYRFDVTVNGVPNFIGATHFQEVAFMFNNINGNGYAVNPFGNLSAEDTRHFDDLAKYMSRSWVSFMTTGDPNHNGGPFGVQGTNGKWPVYNVSAGGGEGWNMVFTVNGSGSYLEPDTYRAEGMAFISESALGVYGR